MMIGTILRLAVVLSTASAGRLLAQNPALIPAEEITGCDFKTGEIHAACLPNYLAYLIGALFSITGVIFLLMLIIGGYQYVLGSAGYGNKEEGIARIRFAVIGFIVTALSFYIVEFVLDVIG